MQRGGKELTFAKSTLNLLKTSFERSSRSSLISSRTAATLCIGLAPSRHALETSAAEAMSSKGRCLMICQIMSDGNQKLFVEGATVRTTGVCPFRSGGSNATMALALLDKDVKTLLASDAGARPDTVLVESINVVTPTFRTIIGLNSLGQAYIAAMK
jgi:hypothetical protein